MQNPWRLLRAALAASLLAMAVAPGPAAVAQAPPPPRQAPAQLLAPTGPGLPPSLNPPPGCGTNTVQASTTPNLAIPDFSDTPGIVTSTIVISNTGSFLFDIGASTHISHTYNDDLEIYLISPQGTRVTLSSNNGLGHDNVFAGTQWIDGAGYDFPPGPVTLATFAHNVVQPALSPEEPLGALFGEDPNGTWRLEIHDEALDDVGTLHSWSLAIQSLTETPVTRTYTRFSIDGVIPDGGVLTRPILFGDTYGVVGEIELYAEVSHTKTNDLLIELQLLADDAQPITLSSLRGGTLADTLSATTWRDNAGATHPPGAITDYSFVFGDVAAVIAPQEPLSAWTGLDAQDSSWALRLTDTDNNGHTGEINNIRMQITTYFCQPVLVLDIARPSPARLGAPVPAHLVVSNDGTAASAPVYITATLPLSASFASAGGPGWACNGPAPNTLGGTLLCSRPTLAMGAASTVTVLFNSPAAPSLLGELDAEAGTAGAANTNNPSDDVEISVAAPSANGNPWDVDDRQFCPDCDDRGEVRDGGQDAFDRFGGLKLTTLELASLQQATAILAGFGLEYAPGHRWRTTTPVQAGVFSVARSLYAPADENWLRYVDTITNTSGASHIVLVMWGGNLGSDGLTKTAATSSGNEQLTQADTWAVTFQNNPLNIGVAEDAPVGYTLRSPADISYQGPGVFDADTFLPTWPITGEDQLGHIFQLQLAPGASASLAYFLYRGLAEDDPGPHDCEYYGDCLPQPAAGTQVALAEAAAAALAAEPDFCDLTDAEFAKIVNWPGAEKCAARLLYLPVIMR